MAYNNTGSIVFQCMSPTGREVLVCVQGLFGIFDIQYENYQQDLSVPRLSAIITTETI